MPNIKEYTSPINGVTPNPRGEQAMETAARRIGTAYYQGAADMRDSARALGAGIGSAAKDIGDAALQHMAQHEISQGAAGLAGLQADITQEWNETAKSANPNDPNLAKNFRAGLEDRYTKFVDSFDTGPGREWAEQQVAHLRQHMLEKTSADQMTMAGDALVQNLDVLKNRASSLVRDDPTSLGSALGLVDNSVKSLIDNSPNLSAVQAEKVRGELTQHIKAEVAKSAVVGVADRNPQAAINLVNSGKLDDYITGDDARHLVSYAQSQLRMKRIDADLAQSAAKRAQEQASQDQTQNYLKSFVDKTGNVTVPPGAASAILKDTKLLPAAKVELIGFANRIASQSRVEQLRIVTDPTVRQDLISRMSLPLGQPGAYSALDLYKLHAEGKLSEQDLTTFKDAQEALVNDPMHRGPLVANALKAAHTELTYSMPGLPGKDPKGETAYADFVGHFYPTVVQMMQDGKLTADALNLRDPNSVISKALAPYKRTAAQKLADRVAELTSLAGGPATDKVKALLATPGAMQRTVDGKMQIKIGNTIYDGTTGEEIKS